MYDNYGAEGSADKAMRVLRSGGVYLLMPHGEYPCSLPLPCIPSSPLLSSHARAMRMCSGTLPWQRPDRSRRC